MSLAMPILACVRIVDRASRKVCEALLCFVTPIEVAAMKTAALLAAASLLLASGAFAQSSAPATTCRRRPA
jgi:hypothetical protein